MPFDLLIRNGLLFDGAGTAGMPGDVAIAGDCIIAIGPKLPADAGKTIDATGRCARLHRHQNPFRLHLAAA
jgi:N-acyl-D-amino-acid deacylase